MSLEHIDYFQYEIHEQKAPYTLHGEGYSLEGWKDIYRHDDLIFDYEAVNLQYYRRSDVQT